MKITLHMVNFTERKDQRLCAGDALNCKKAFAEPFQAVVLKFFAASRLDPIVDLCSSVDHWVFAAEKLKYDFLLQILLVRLYRVNHTENYVFVFRGNKTELSFRPKEEIVDDVPLLI